MGTNGGLNFGKMLATRASTAEIEPSKLYEALPKKARGYGYLRLVQGQVLEKWHLRRNQRDVVIKVNTGGGKTIDGLIILQSLLNEKRGPALYVAPDPFLVEQVMVEASKLGLVAVSNPDDPRYLRSEAICVVTADRVFNGRSIFASTRAPRIPAPIGSVVIDDAHAAIATTRKQLSLSIPAKNPAFQAILNMFASELESYSPNAFLDVTERSPSALARIPFWMWREKSARVLTVLRQHSESDDIKFGWPAVKDCLTLSRAVFSGTELTITPLCPPIHHISNFMTAHHRIFLTATLADDGVLVTDFDADPVSVADPITPATAGDIGERMILAPQEINPAVGAAEIRTAMKKLSLKQNVVVLCPSYRAAELWKGLADQIAGADPKRATTTIAAAVEELRTAKGSRLIVMVSKYDGIDLPDEACRVLVIDGLPEAFSPEDRLESHLTSRSSGTDDRQIQRIEQGMGRGVRSNEDYCVVVLIGPRLSQLVSHPDTISRFSPATQAQLALAGEIAGGLRNLPLGRILSVVNQSLDRDTDWVEFAKGSIAGLTPRPAIVGAESIARRQAFAAAHAGNVSKAEALIRVAADESEDPRTKGWLLEQLALYTDSRDPAAAQEILQSARDVNSDVLRPVITATYVPLTSTVQQGLRAHKEITGSFLNPTDMMLGFESLIADLAFEKDRAEEFESAFDRLGKLIGVNSARPEKETGIGPDNLWALDSGRFWVFEAKSGATTNFIAKSDVNQLAGSVNWFSGKYLDGQTATPVMAHIAKSFGQGATAVPGMKLMSPRTLGDLATQVRSFAKALSEQWMPNSAEVESLLHSHRLAIEDLSGYLTSPAASKN